MSILSSYIADVAIFWPGIPEVQVAQQLPPGLAAVDGQMLETESSRLKVLAGLQQSVMSSNDQDIRCQLKFALPCG